MCAIAGGKNVKEMLKKMGHRAPDGFSVYEGKGITIGMGRLSILDLESNDLCLYSENGIYVSFNGEIYNWKELKRELENKFNATFRSNCDIEVLTKAYIYWGKDCVDKFNGMFAFAILDEKKEEVFMSRDIAGEKPLYYKENPFEFSSEAKALGFDCKEFPPAHSAVYSLKKRSLKIWKWWKMKEREIDGRFAVEELEDLLQDSINLRTQADVPYGLFLSDGIDSTLISTFHDFENTFTYQDGDYKEEFKRRFPDILWHLDYPVSSFSPFGLWKLSESASKKVKVVLSGEGADELFGGYVRYLAPHYEYNALNHYPSYKPVLNRAESVNEQGWKEFNGNMRELLRMGDRMTSAFGLEGRLPFLDRRIIEFAFNLHETWKIQNFETKVILRKILKKRKPEYRVKEKHGLFCDVNKWIGSGEKFDKIDYSLYQDQIWKTFQ